MSTPSAETDAQLAARLAEQAGALLVETRRLLDLGIAPWEVMDRGDQVAQHFLATELASARPDDAVLSEEGLEDPRRFAGGRVWIVDPLDGTREFGEAGRPDWAVHVALWDGAQLVAAAVALPAMGLVMRADQVAPSTAPARPAPVLVTSRSRNPASAVIVAHTLGCRAVRLGSAGAKAMAVVRGEADIYVHDGGMYQWDSAAPVGVALAAGLHATRIDGSPIVYNELDPWLPDLLICRPALAEPILTALWGEHRPAPRREQRPTREQPASYTADE